MTYIKQTWTNGVSAVNATRMSYIEDGIEAAHALATGGGYENPVIVVAASNSTAAVKAVADYVCGTSNAQTQINSAITEAAGLSTQLPGSLSPGGATQRGTVFLAGGDYNCSSTIQMRTAVHLTGSYLSHVKAVACNSAGLLTLANPSDHLCLVTNLWLDGNSSSGGSCNGIDFDSTGSTNGTGIGVGTYPASSPDTYNQVSHCFVNNFQNVGTRSCVFMHGGGQGRGPVVTHVITRDSYNGINYSSSQPDGQISNCQAGTMDNNGFIVGTGNTIINSCKAFYCDNLAFDFSSGRHVATALMSQDNANGFNLASSDSTFGQLLSDTDNGTGIAIAATGVQLHGFTVMNRGTAGGGRYNSTAVGLQLNTNNDCSVFGRINPSLITTKIAGTHGSRCAYAYSDGTTLTQS